LTFSFPSVGVVGEEMLLLFRESAMLKEMLVVAEEVVWLELGAGLVGGDGDRLCWLSTFSSSCMHSQAGFPELFRSVVIASSPRMAWK